MSVTQKEIAEKLGISRALVGLALKGHKRVSKETRRLVEEAALEMSYRPNSAAQALVGGRTKQILFTTFSQTSSAINECVRRLIIAVQRDEYQLLVRIAPNQDDIGAIHTTDGAIFFGTVPPSFRAAGLPVVSLRIDMQGENAGGIEACDVVQIILEDSCREAIEHLIERGRRRIAYVSLRSMMADYDPRYRAYHAVMEKANLELEPLLVDFQQPFGLRDTTFEALQKYFQEHGFPDALFCSCDDVAIGAYRALRSFGREIPGQTAVIGGDNIEEVVDQAPPLSVVAFPFEDMCQRAWEMLRERMEDPELPYRHERIKAKFVARGSS